MKHIKRLNEGVVAGMGWLEKNEPSIARLINGIAGAIKKDVPAAADWEFDLGSWREGGEYQEGGEYIFVMLIVTNRRFNFGVSYFYDGQFKFDMVLDRMFVFPPDAADDAKYNRDGIDKMQMAQHYADNWEGSELKNLLDELRGSRLGKQYGIE